GSQAGQSSLSCLFRYQKHGTWPLVPDETGTSPQADCHHFKLTEIPRERHSLGEETRRALAARLKPPPSPKATELSLGLDGSETRPYTTIIDPSPHNH